MSKAILPDATTTYDLGSTSKKYNTVHAKATSAQYADLAEVYDSDSRYDVGTVVVFGGEKEVTQSTISNDTRVAGVVSENPAYLMDVLERIVDGEIPNQISVSKSVEEGSLLALERMLSIKK